MLSDPGSLGNAVSFCDDTPAALLAGLAGVRLRDHVSSLLKRIQLLSIG